jgi:hypothetical protein
MVLWHGQSLQLDPLHTKQSTLNKPVYYMRFTKNQYLTQCASCLLVRHPCVQRKIIFAGFRIRICFHQTLRKYYDYIKHCEHTCLHAYTNSKGNVYYSSNHEYKRSRRSRVQISSRRPSTSQTFTCLPSVPPCI